MYCSIELSLKHFLQRVKIHDYIKDREDEMENLFALLFALHFPTGIDAFTE